MSAQRKPNKSDTEFAKFRTDFADTVGPAYLEELQEDHIQLLSLRGRVCKMYTAPFAS